MLEAMACGRPVVISEFDHLRDIGNGAGRRSRRGTSTPWPGDPESLEHPDEADELGRQGTRDDHPTDSWRNTVEATLDLYRESSPT